MLGALGVANTVSVGTSTAPFLTGHAQRTALMVQNLGTGTVYFGPKSTLTAANGIQLLPGASLNLPTRGPVYAISTVAATDVRYWDVY